MLDQIIFYFLLLLGIGSIFSYGILRPAELGPRFFLYHGLGTIVAMAAAFYFKPADFNGETKLALISLAGALAVSSGVIRHLWGNFAVATFSFVAGLLYLGAGNLMVAPLIGVPTVSTAMVTYNLVSVALVLGFSMTAMWLGHWYLTQPKLSIDELKRTTLVLAALLLVRTAVAAATLLPRLPGTEVEIYRFLAGSTGIFLMMRTAWGLAVPLILVVMVWKTVAIRSTQSATGILYVLLLSVLAGETLSLYLMFHDGWIA